MSATPRRATLATGLATVDERLPPDTPPAARLSLALAEPTVNADDAPSGPTRTRTIQTDYSAEMYKRFRRLKGLVRQTVDGNDAFGLRDTEDVVRDISDLERERDLDTQASPTRRYDFPQTAAKIDAFLDDLQAWEDDEILDVFQRGPNGRVVARDEWQNIYVRRSYAKGVEWADARLREQGVDVPASELAQMFNTPIHADALGILYTRNFRELAGITDAMDQQISRVLSRGFAEGWNPRRMASEINDRVEKVGLTRARTLARTETINAHSESTLNRYESILGPEAEVTGKAEFATAGDHRVCPICISLEGSVYTLEEARGVIPVHPNCRCAWLPVVNAERARNIARTVV